MSAKEIAETFGLTLKVASNIKSEANKLQREQKQNQQQEPSPTTHSQASSSLEKRRIHEASTQEVDETPSLTGCVNKKRCRKLDCLPKSEENDYCLEVQ